MHDEALRYPAEHLLRNRIIILSGDITTRVAEWVITRLLVLDNIDPEAEIALYLMSAGGSVRAGFAIYDTMLMVGAPVSTLAIGPAFSMAAWLLAAGERGRRFATPNSKIMIHQSSAGTFGTAADVKIAAQQLLDSERRLNELLATHTQRSVEEIEQAVQRDCWMSPTEAKEFGLIDAIAPIAETKRRAE
jgi:ATP-dependent Clp protease protease subunit